MADKMEANNMKRHEHFKKEQQWKMQANQNGKGEESEQDRICNTSNQTWDQRNKN